MKYSTRLSDAVHILAFIALQSISVVILLSFGYDPLYCPHCKKEMLLVEIYHNHKRVPLQELYERAMAKTKCRSA